MLNRCTRKTCTGGSNPPLSARSFGIKPLARIDGHPSMLPPEGKMPHCSEIVVVQWRRRWRFALFFELVRNAVYRDFALLRVRCLR